MNRGLIVAFVLLLTGCAATPMAPDGYSAAIASQEASLRLTERCCTNLAEVPTIRFNTPQLVRISSSSAVSAIGGSSVPVLVFELPPGAEGQFVQVFSFGEKKGGSLRFDRVTFIRARYVFLDQNKDALGPELSPRVCWGDFDFTSSGAWNRAIVPSGARFVVVSPSLVPPNQLVDTRRFSHSLVADAIAERRKSYLRQVSFGFVGELSVSLVDPTSTSLRSCTIDSGDDF